MKKYKNFNEIGGKFQKLSRKYYEILKKKSPVLNICWNFEKNLSHFWENFM